MVLYDKWVGQTVAFNHLLCLPLVGAGSRTLTTVWRKRQETGLGGGRCLGGTFEDLSRMSWSPLLYLYTLTHTLTHTHRETSALAPLLSLPASSCLPLPGNVRCYVMIDGLHSETEQPPLFVCLCYAWLQNDSWDQCTVLGLSGKKSWAPLVLACLLFLRTKEMGVSECPQKLIPFVKPCSFWALRNFEYYKLLLEFMFYSKLHYAEEVRMISDLQVCACV